MTRKQRSPSQRCVLCNRDPHGMPIKVTNLSHVNVTVPQALEDATKYFYASIMGLAEVPKPPEDRKSTRLNSSHITISYAVFCLKKKKKLNKLHDKHQYNNLILSMSLTQ